MVRTISLPTCFTAIAVLFLTAGLAQAQSRSVYIPPDAKGFRALQLRQEAMRQSQTAASPTAPHEHHSSGAHHSPAPVNIQITCNIPSNYNPPAVIAIRGPEGDVRTFKVEGGRAAYPSRVILRPGERITIQLTPAAPTMP